MHPDMHVRVAAEVPHERRPLETSREGVFAIGDVRAGSIKRVAAAVGEGAEVIATIHRFLADTSELARSASGRGRM